VQSIGADDPSESARPAGRRATRRARTIAAKDTSDRWTIRVCRT